MDPRVGATSDGQVHPVPPQNQTEATFHLGLNCPQPRLLRPASKTTALILEDEFRCQTSSSSTISVESDRRGPSFKIRE